MAERSRQRLSDLGLFTGAPQLEHFCRMQELVETRPMTRSSASRQWVVGAPVELPDRFSFMTTQWNAADLLAKGETAALLVVQDGVIRHEHYALTGGGTVPWLSMSVAKSFISALVGIAIGEGLIGGVE